MSLVYQHVSKNSNKTNKITTYTGSIINVKGKAVVHVETQIHHDLSKLNIYLVEVKKKKKRMP